MRNYHQDYFYIMATGKNTPRLSFDKNQITDTHLLFARRPLDESYMISLKFGRPIPDNPELGDVLEKLQHTLVSDQLKALFQGMELKKVQFLPTEIRNPNTDDIYTGYWVMHIYNLIRCLNREASKYDTCNDQITSIERLVFDHEALEKVPLNERLVFALDEQRLSMFYHRSVVEQIVALHPTNVQFNCLATKEEVTDPLPETLSDYINYRVKKVEKKEEVLDMKERHRRKLLAHGIIKDTLPVKPEDEDIPEI